MECNSARLSLLECTEGLGTCMLQLFENLLVSKKREGDRVPRYLGNLKRCKPDDEDAASFAKMVRSQVRKMYMYM